MNRRTDTMSGDASRSSDGLDARLEKWQQRVARTVEMLRGSRLDVQPFRPREDGPLGSYQAPAGEDEIDRYWVNPPYAYVVITYDPEASEHRYNVVEPDLDPFATELLNRVFTDIRDPLLYGTERSPTAEETHRCYVAITQTHAPLLDELGLLEYHDRVQKLGGTEDTVLLERLLNQNRDVCQGGDDADHGGAGVL